MIIAIPLLIAVIGALLYIFTSNAKLQELGRLAYAVGLLAFLLRAAEGMVNLMHK